MTSGELRKRFDELAPLYERLGSNIQAALRQLLDAQRIEALDVFYRVKSFESFREKIGRKQYVEPFAEMPDICGVRIITFNPRDLLRIDQLIQKEFHLHQAVNQAQRLHEDQFGYRSNHYVVSLRPSWVEAPSYRGLGHLRAEIQVRTILMHAWADLSHRLSYKSVDQAPLELRRRIYQLGALFELADEDFARLTDEKRRFQESLVREASADPKGFDTAQALNVDSLQAFLRFRFPDRTRSDSATADFVSELQQSGITLADLDRGIQILGTQLESLEREWFALLEGAHIPIKPVSSGRLGQIGVARLILDLTSDKYWTVHRRGLPPRDQELVEKLRTKVRHG